MAKIRKAGKGKKLVRAKKLEKKQTLTTFSDFHITHPTEGTSPK